MPRPLDLNIHLAPLFKGALKVELERVLNQIELLLGAGHGVTQPEWYVNSVTGDDSNDGETPATALKTLAELNSRMGFSIIQQYTRVYLEGDFSAEPLMVRVSSELDGSGNAYPLAIFGVATTLHSGTITATANQSVGAASPPQITDGGVADWTTAGPGGTSLIGKRLRITAAPNDAGDLGKYVWLKRDDGGGACTTSFASAPIDPASGALPGSISLTGLASPPYDYVVEELPQIQTFVHSPLFLTRVNVVGLSGPPGVDCLVQATGGFLGRMLIFDGCDIKNIVSTTAFPGFFGCRMESPDFFGVGGFVSGCLIDNGPITSSARQLFLAGNTLAQGNSLYQGSDLGASSSFCGIIVGGASCYDSPGTGVALEIGSSLHCYGGLFHGNLHGTGNTVGVDVGTNSAFLYDKSKSNYPTITGTTEVIVGSTSTTWAAIDAAGGLIETTPPTLARVLRK